MNYISHTVKCLCITLLLALTNSTAIHAQEIPPEAELIEALPTYKITYHFKTRRLHFKARVNHYNGPYFFRMYSSPQRRDELYPRHNKTQLMNEMLSTLESLEIDQTLPESTFINYQTQLLKIIDSSSSPSQLHEANRNLLLCQAAANKITSDDLVSKLNLLENNELTPIENNYTKVIRIGLLFRKRELEEGLKALYELDPATTFVYAHALNAAARGLMNVTAEEVAIESEDPEHIQTMYRKSLELQRILSEELLPRLEEHTQHISPGDLSSLSNAKFAYGKFLDESKRLMAHNAYSDIAEDSISIHIPKLLKSMEEVLIPAIQRNEPDHPDQYSIDWHKEKIRKHREETLPSLLHSTRVLDGTAHPKQIAQRKSLSAPQPLTMNKKVLGAIFGIIIALILFPYERMSRKSHSE